MAAGRDDFSSVPYRRHFPIPYSLFPIPYSLSPKPYSPLNCAFLFSLNAATPSP